MSDPESPIISDLADFLAHARMLEHEAVERYQELADCMEVHNNLEVSALFRKLAGFGEEHTEAVERRAAGLDLPKIMPWEFKWICPEGPETACMDEAHYLMDIRQALRLAMLNEERARDFYEDVARLSPSAEVRSLATEFASEEAEHVLLLKQWIADLVGIPGPTLEDLDPPNMPE